MQPLSNMIVQCYNDICQANEDRVHIFFNQLQTDCHGIYIEKMQSALDGAVTYLQQTDLTNVHRITKDKALALVC